MVLIRRYNRLLIFGLASLSFACLLGQFYGTWSMRTFAGSILLPATTLLAVIAIVAHDKKSGPALWIIEGSLGGLIAAVAYDLFRLPFVLSGYPLFDVFPRFGQMLLGASPLDFSLPVQLTGWAYHFSNGAALGIMFLSIVAPAIRMKAVPRGLLWKGVLCAVGVEIILLLTPYYSFFKLKLDFATFLGLTLSAHIVFGLVLGWWCQRRLQTVTLPFGS